jgi:microcystin degradation protein MlrC
MVGSYPTMVEPMRGLVNRMREAEKQAGMLSISFVHGFPWGDTPESGSKVLAISDGDPQLAKRVAAEIGRMIYAERAALLPKVIGIEEALDEAGRRAGRIVLADFGDNAGGGAPSDNVTLLRAMLARNLQSAAFGVVWDPIAASVCREAGVGATFALRLGGKSGPASGAPLDVVASVRAIRQDHVQTGLGAETIPLGLSVWITVEGIDVVIGSKRTQVFSPDAFSGLGVNLRDKRTIVVKSSQHFRTGFAPLADAILVVATPGALQMDFAAFAYRKKRDLDYFPRQSDPLGLG